jgi:predicted ATPase
LVSQARFEAQGRQSVKGFSEPMTVWRLVEITQQDDSGIATPFVGRSAELAQITALLDHCGTGAGAIVYVRGEPGIGKSRLVREACAAAARRGLSCYIAHVLDFGAGQQGDPLRRVAHALLRLRTDASPEERSAAARTLVQSELIDASLEPFLHELAGGVLAPAMLGRIDASDEQTRRAKREEALLFLVRRELARGPMLLVIEDLHWAEASLANALPKLASLVTDQPLILALTSRPENERPYESLRAQVRGARADAAGFAPGPC